MVEGVKVRGEKKGRENEGVVWGGGRVGGGGEGEEGGEGWVL